LNFVELSASRVLNFIYSVSDKPLPRLGTDAGDSSEIRHEILLHYDGNVANCFMGDDMVLGVFRVEGKRYAVVYS
jgi:hypothetical protein